MSGGAVNVVTMISSKRQAERQHARRRASAERICGKVTSRKVVNPAAPRSIDASSNPVPHTTQPRERVVVDDDDAERRVTDHDRQEGQAAEVAGEHVVERDTGDDAGQRDRQDRPAARRSLGRRTRSAPAPSTPACRAPGRSAVAIGRDDDRRTPARRGRPGSRPSSATTRWSTPCGGQEKVRSALNELMTMTRERDVDERHPEEEQHAEHDARRAGDGHVRGLYRLSSAPVRRTASR